MDDSIRYPAGETLGKVVSGFMGRALNLFWGFGRQVVKGDLRVRTPAGQGRALPGAASERGSPGIRALAGGAVCWSRPLGLPAVRQRRRSFSRLTQDWVAQQEAGTSLFCHAELAC